MLHQYRPTGIQASILVPAQPLQKEGVTRFRLSHSGYGKPETAVFNVFHNSLLICFSVAAQIDEIC